MRTTFDLLSDLWPAVLISVCYLGACLILGWKYGRFSRQVPVRLVDGWLRSVVIPLLKSRSWWRRTAVIFVNNALVSAAVIGAGAWSAGAWICVGYLGLSLGIGFRRLAYCDHGWSFPPEPASPRTRRRIHAGLTLNMLEPPAILIVAALSLGRHLASPVVEAAEAWNTFLIWLVPALLTAAGGEALWIGEAVHGDHPPDDDRLLPDQETVN